MDYKIIKEQLLLASKEIKRQDVISAEKVLADLFGASPDLNNRMKQIRLEFVSYWDMDECPEYFTEWVLTDLYKKYTEAVKQNQHDQEYDQIFATAELLFEVSFGIMDSDDDISEVFLKAMINGFDPDDVADYIYMRDHWYPDEDPDSDDLFVIRDEDDLMMEERFDSEEEADEEIQRLMEEILNKAGEAGKGEYNA